MLDLMVALDLPIILVARPVGHDQSTLLSVHELTRANLKCSVW